MYGASWNAYFSAKRAPRRRVGRFAIGMLFVIAAGAAASFEESHRAVAAQNPADVLFVVSAAQGAFHQGEMIPITLAFSSSAPDKYTLDTANYDRSGRPLSEEYVLDARRCARPARGLFRIGHDAQYRRGSS